MHYEYVKDKDLKHMGKIAICPQLKQDYHLDQIVASFILKHYIQFKIP